MADEQPEKTHIATLHGWYIDDGTEYHVLRRDDGRWFVQDNQGGEPEFLSQDEAVTRLSEFHYADGPSGWLRGISGGEDFDKQYAEVLASKDRERG